VLHRDTLENAKAGARRAFRSLFGGDYELGLDLILDGLEWMAYR
jgi:hypothetical protein